MRAGQGHRPHRAYKARDTLRPAAAGPGSSTTLAKGSPTLPVLIDNSMTALINGWAMIHLTQRAGGDLVSLLQTRPKRADSVVVGEPFGAEPVVVPEPDTATAALWDRLVDTVNDDAPCDDPPLCAASLRVDRCPRTGAT